MITGIPVGIFSPLGQVTVVDSKTAYIGMLKTSDSGKSWRNARITLDDTQYSLSIESFSFPTPEVGYAVGAFFRPNGSEDWNSCLFKTTNGGEDWIPVPTTFRTDETFIHFSTPDKGVVISAKGIYHTADGGKTWVPDSSVYSLDYGTIQVSFASSLCGCIYCYGSISKMYRTVDGGETWSMICDDPPYLVSMVFPSPNTGFGASPGELYKTRDGGATWDRVNTFHNTVGGSALFFLDDSIGYCYGHNGILKTVDGGISWGRQAFPEIATVAFFDENTGFGCTGGVLYRTNDGGNSWSITGVSSNFHTVTCFDDRTILSWGYSSSLRTENGGEAWTESSLPYGITNIVHSSGRLLATGTVYAIGKPAGTSRAHIILAASDDRGLTWNTIAVPGTQDYRASEIQFPGPETGYILAYDENFLRSHVFETKDGGETWTEKPSPGVVGKWYVSFPTPRTGYLAGSGGRILKTSDGASTWKELSSGVTDSLFCVHFPDEMAGFAGGKNGVLIRTNDGGKTWWQCVTSTKATIRTIKFITPDVGYFGGDSGVLYKTVDGGISWRPQNTHTDQAIRSIDAYSRETVYAVGGSGTILKADADPLFAAESTEYPKMMNLESHPNPFNPSTTLSFTLPSPGRAELSVYSVTGQKIRTLLSGPMSAGTHSAVWDGKSDAGKAVSSGIYIAQVHSGKQVAGHKMLLMK